MEKKVIIEEIMLKSFYSWFHRKISRPEEKDEPSGGIWPDLIRRETAYLCRDFKGRLLEIGCGEGLFIRHLAVLNPQLELCGVDNNPDKLSAAKKKCETQQLKKVRTIYADAEHLPFKNGAFDNVVCINVFLNLESIALVSRILTEACRVCHEHGRIIFDFRNGLNPLLILKYKLAPYYDRTVKEACLPLNTYKPKEIEELLKKFNLKIITRKYIGFPENILAPVIIIEAEKC